MSQDRIVRCRKLGKDLPGLTRVPYRNELGQKIFDEVSKEAWDGWLRDSVKYINTYRVDFATIEGQKFMLKQCAIYFGYEEGELLSTAWTPPKDDAGKPNDKPNDKAGP
jgi:Fe-S cluster biosynthesis and repair protein YggX